MEMQDLKSKIRPAASDAKYALRTSLVSWLTAALKKLDRSYEANVRDMNVDASPQAAVPPNADLAKPPVRVSAPAVVMDEGGVVRGGPMLKVVLCAIFETENLTGVPAALFERLLMDGFWPSQAAVGEAAYKLALAELAKGGDDAAAWADAIVRISAFLENALGNAAAYKRSNKLHPDAVYWPDPTHSKSPRILSKESPICAAEKFVDRTTPIGSAGSCFAMEIAHRLQTKKFNYVVTEPNPNVVNGLSDSCARWGTIFNAPAFRQLVEKSFGVLTLPRVVFTEMQDGEMRYCDPFREGVSFRTIEEYEQQGTDHLLHAREALIRSKVFVLTLGMNEVWRLRSGGYVLSRSPWAMASSLCNKQVLSIDENLSELRRMTAVWRAHNPDVKFIVSVSPVPLLATFQADRKHVVVANCHAKSTLRVVAEEFCRTVPGAYYFPSYESVMYCTDGAWEPDLRHVSRAAVDKVMALFDQMFVAEG
jgi:hypothetical protein